MIGVGKTLISEKQIQERIKEMADRISEDYAGKDVVLVGVLKGAFMLMSDLARQIDLPIEFDFMAVSSYGSETDSSGVVRILKDLERNVADRDVIIVEDIVDTGLTLHYLQDLLKARAPRSMKTACLLSKPSRRKIEVKVDYIGFSIEDKFVVGYGLDYAEQYRNLPYIAVLDTPEA